MTARPTQPVARGDAIDFQLECMTVEQGLQLIETERVQPLLKYLKTGVFENKTNMTFMKAYSVVVQFGDAQEPSYKLYNYYKKVMTEYCEDNKDRLEDCSGEELLKRLAELWEKLAILTFWMQRVFQYLDRFFLQPNHDTCPNLFLTALQSFKNCVYSNIKGRCVNAMIEAIDRERNGYDTDVAQLDMMRQLVEMFCTVGDPLPKIVKHKTATQEKLFWQSASKGVYKTDFEVHLLSSTADYYRAKVSGWLAERTCPEFLEEVSRRLEDEDRRLNLYLDRESCQALRDVVTREIILNTGKQLVEMETGCKHMFVNKKYSELTLMFKLFKREPEKMLPYMTAIMEPYIEERCTRIVEDQALLDNPTAYIEQVLDLKRELDEMVANCFDNEPGFQKARNRGLENVLNKDTRCAKYLALFAHQFKKGVKGRSEDEVTRLVDEVVNLFVHLKDKDIFLECYKRSLSRRLLNKLSVSIDAEDHFHSRLKVEVGQQAIQKFVAMFADMSLSDSLQEEYNKLTHNGAPGGITHEIRVLQTNAWPEKPDDCNISVCDELNVCVKAFEQFYHQKHNGRKLKWVYNMGGAEMSACCFPKKHILVVSTYQCLALMVFNKQSEVTFKQICDATSMPKEECRRQVLSMTVSKHRLLLRDHSTKEIEDQTKLEVNTAFTNEKIKVVVGLIKKEEKKEEQAVPEAPTERKHEIDAAIVRIMKSRKKLDHTSLLEEVFRHCTLFKPQPATVKTQIEHLIEREFLERDAENRNVYIYLA